jgi:acetyltransferase-like isoleucine patch superfamily enzyme
LQKVTGQAPTIDNKGKITLGQNCRFRALRAPISLDTTNAAATLFIGDNCFFNHGVNISSSLSIKIGNNTRIGDNVTIFDSNFHCVDQTQKHPKIAPVVIGKNVWIGANAVILAGAHVGDHSVVAAGAIVSGKVEPKCLVAGNPAKKIKDLICDDNWIRS